MGRRVVAYNVVVDNGDLLCTVSVEENACVLFPDSPGALKQNKRKDAACNRRVIIIILLYDSVTSSQEVSRSQQDEPSEVVSSSGSMKLLYEVKE